MHPWVLECIQLDMKAMDRNTELLNEYRMALGLWSEVRAHYSLDEPAVVAATRYLESLEQDLTSLSQPAIAA
jgi:hypothetical protein